MSVPERPRRREGLETSDVGDGAELVLLDPATDRVVSLNSSAAAIWYLCDGTRDAHAIALEVLGAVPGLDPRAVEGEVRRTLEMLAHHQLVDG